jgi:hypothetical protein
MPLLGLALIFAAAAQGGLAYTIAGEIHDRSGKPAAGVRITAYPSELADRTKPPRSVVADADGRFSIPLDRSGKYLVVYDGSDQGYLSSYNPFFRDPDNPPPQVLLTEQSPTAQVFISVSKNGVLSGEALDTQTQFPVDNLRFTMCHVNSGPCWSVNAKSATGSFSIPAPFVPFLLHITSPQFEDWFGLTGSDFSAPVMVPAGTNTSLRLLLKRRPDSANQAISEEEKRPGINLPAPIQVSPEDNQIFDIFPRDTKLEWAPVDGAVSYSVEIDVCQPARKGLQPCPRPQTLRLLQNPPSQLVNTTYEFRFVGAQPGRWRVWAVDKEGRDGFKSPWRTFVYLH